MVAPLPHLQWQDGRPATEERAITVQVTVVEDAAGQPNQGVRMAEALERLAAGALATLEKPGSMEREVREDRGLLDRGQCS